MKRSVSTCLLVLSVVLFSVVTCFAGHGEARPEKKGILLVAFGSSMPQAQVSFENIDKAVKAKFPGVAVRWAYTSAIIRHKLAKQGKILDSTAIALAKMMEENFTHVAVQSLHTIRGEEYDDLDATAKAFMHMPQGISRIVVGAPLLSVESDMEAVVDAIIANSPKQRKKEDALVLMGHGSPHPANAFYAALMFHLQRKDPNIFVGTVEGAPEIDEIQEMLKEKKIKKAYLMPFMSVAGDHARNDMASDEDDSWKSILTKSGIMCETVLKGTAEFDNMVDVWVDHLAQAMEHL